MKSPASPFALLAFTLLVPVLSAANPSPEMKAALAVGLGTPTAPATLDSEASFDQAIMDLSEYLADTPAARVAVAQRAAAFVHGTTSDIDEASANDDLFATQVAAQLGALAEDSAAYQQVLQRAYRYVVGRDVYEEEIAYWDNYATLPYALLVGCIEDWARRNQPGLMNTAGTPTVSVNCELLVTTRLDPAFAEHVAKWLELPAATPVLAPGAAELQSSGGIRFLVTGVR